jgi:hypothetical protein
MTRVIHVHVFIRAYGTRLTRVTLDLSLLALAPKVSPGACLPESTQSPPSRARQCIVAPIHPPVPLSTRQFLPPGQLAYKKMIQTVIFCDTATKCQTAAVAFETSTALVLDCEGDNLGTSGGRLSLIILRGVSPDSQTYIIDVPQLTLTSLKPILDLLRSPNIQKIVFDGRMDFSALYHELGVELQNVLDLQLVDIMSRYARGEGWETQRKRLQSWLKTDELKTCPQLYFQVHRLSGLDGCIAEHAVIPRKAGKPFKPKGQFQSQTTIFV